MQGTEEYVNERLDHLGIVAGVCKEIGLAEWLDAQDEQSHERVGVGTATVAMILNGLGFSNRRQYRGAAVLCDQGGGAVIGAGDHRGGSQRRLPGTGVGLVVCP